MEKGQTIIEILVAFGVAVMLVSAVTLMVIFALSNAQFSTSQNAATQYAQQGMEFMRQKRNEGEIPPTGVQCLPIVSNTSLSQKEPLPNCSATNGFTREVNVQSGQTQCPQSFLVNVTVSWADGKCTSHDPTKLYCHSVQLVSCLSGVAP